MKPTSALSVLAGLAIAGVVILSALGKPVPELLGLVITTAIGGAAGVAVQQRPAEGKRQASTAAAGDDEAAWLARLGGSPQRDSSSSGPVPAVGLSEPNKPPATYHAGRGTHRLGGPL